MDSKKSSQKLRKALTDCKVLKEPPGFGPKSLSESSGIPRDCAYRLQKSLDQNLSESSRTPRYYVHKFHKCLETRGFRLKNCVPKLQKSPSKFHELPCNICQLLHESPTIVLTKCERLCPRQKAQEMWGCTLHTCLPTTTTEKYSQSYRPYREIFLGN